MIALDLAVQLVHASTLDLGRGFPPFPPFPPAVQLVHQGSGPPLALSGTLARPWQDLGHLLATSYRICPTSCRPRIWVSGTGRLTHRYLSIRTTNRVFWVQQVIIKYILDMSALDLAVQLEAQTLVTKLSRRGGGPAP